MELLILIFLITLALAFGLSKLVIYWFGRRLLDIPNTRSSHTIPTPRGGGIAIALATLIAALTAHFMGLINHTTLHLLAPGLLMAIVGITDDLITLNIRIRLFAQTLTACVITLITLDDTLFSAPIFVLLGIASVIGIVWLTNLYNFMDGINGLAGLQAIFVCSSVSLLFYLQGTYNEIILLMLIISSANLGFLYWNFPKAKLFMGDVGSLFIGITLATLIVWTAQDNLLTICYWLIILAAFIADASYTIFIRATTGQKFYLPHRSHFYQKIAMKLNSHTKATLLIMAFNLIWLLPLALVVLFGHINAFAGICLAYLPAIYAAHKVRAGKAEE